MLIYLDWFLGELSEKISYERYDPENNEHVEILKDLISLWSTLFKKVQTEKNDELYYICVLEKVLSKNKYRDLITCFADFIKASIENKIISKDTFISWRKMDSFDVGYQSSNENGFVFIDEHIHEEILELAQNI